MLASTLALESLQLLREQGSDAAGAAGGEAAAQATVVKLGFSWEAVDVRKVEGGARAETTGRLATALTEAVSAPNCRNDRVLVQSFVPAVCELRLFVVEGAIRGRYFARYEESTDDGRFDGWVRRPRAEVASEWFGGDAAALAQAEAQAEGLVPLLGLVLRGVCAEPQPALRFDFLLRRDGDGRGSAATLEITEVRPFFG